MTREGGADLQAVAAYTHAAVELLATGPNEEVLKQHFLTHLPTMFPQRPAWIARHSRGAESQTRYGEEQRLRSAFIDNLVGYTSIEWEHDLRKKPVFEKGYLQVRQQTAGLINSGAPENQVVGVLSDTVRWRAYRLGKVRRPTRGSPVGPGDIDLEEIASIDISPNTQHEHVKLAEFLERYLGRDGAQPLTADMVAFDLGIQSIFSQRHRPALEHLVTSALSQRPDYADVIEKLWTDFVAYLGGDTTSTGFSVDAYVSEFYMVTLAKLICANVVARRGLNSSDVELQGILNGDHFRARGLTNVVEYDYFGWLNTPPYVDSIVPIAREMQRDLRGYDFDSTPEEDVFGQMLAELAGRLQRVLLGQEWTPTWLARQMARQIVDGLQPGDAPRLIDMCCGSGSMLVQAVHAWRTRAHKDGCTPEVLQGELSQIATGFDVDPLAVLLARVNWVIATRDELPLDEAHPISIPVYLADSLWAKTPVGTPAPIAKGGESYPLELFDESLDLPVLLVSPSRRRLFDAILDHAYPLALAQAKVAGDVSRNDVEVAVSEALIDAGAALSDSEHTVVAAFTEQLVNALAALQRKGLNGIWAFVLRNSYRPGLMVGQFNGLISNPPWLALSKVGSNPYRDTLRAEAEQYGIRPTGASHLHIELATTFLLHAVDYYLRADAQVACVLPDTVLNGHQHTPFRQAAYAGAQRRVDLTVDELWRVESGTFKNEAIVLVGTKAVTTATSVIPGAQIGINERTAIQFHVRTLGDREVWTDEGEGQGDELYEDLVFRQGADIMPRATIFFEVTGVGQGRSRLASIDESRSPLAYLISDAKKLADFRLTPRVVPDRYLFAVLISKHLVPFNVAPPAEAFLPLQRAATGSLQAVSGTQLSATTTANAAFDEILAAHGEGFTIGKYVANLESQFKKLSAQRYPTTGYLVLYGAGGTSPCAAYLSLESVDATRLIVDQTLYWSVVAGEDEATYIVGLFNSDAVERAIREYQPRGQFGARHVHELPGRVTPGFDAADPKHDAVVKTTRVLQAELTTALSHEANRVLLDPARGLAWRRRKVRRDLIPSLDGYGAYERACRDLYRV